jgi:hypothetical protein
MKSHKLTDRGGCTVRVQRRLGARTRQRMGTHARLLPGIQHVRTDRGRLPLHRHTVHERAPLLQQRANPSQLRGLDFKRAAVWTVRPAMGNPIHVHSRRQRVFRQPDERVSPLARVLVGRALASPRAAFLPPATVPARRRSLPAPRASPAQFQPHQVVCPGGGLQRRVLG